MEDTDNTRMRGYVSCVVGCPYEGDIEPEAVADVAVALRDLGCYQISLGFLHIQYQASG